MVISLEARLADRVERAARNEADGDVSAWLADAAQMRLRNMAAEHALRVYEAETGEISSPEIAEIRRLWQRG